MRLPPVELLTDEYEFAMAESYVFQGIGATGWHSSCRYASCRRIAATCSPPDSSGPSNT